MATGVCIYVNCVVRKLTGSSHSFFNVPNDKRRQVWLRHCGLIIDRIYPKRILVCDKHFYPKHIKDISTRKLLAKGAYPIPFDNKCSCSEVNVDPLCIVEQVVDNTPEERFKIDINKLSSPDHLLQCSPSSETYILNYNFPPSTSNKVADSPSQLPSSRLNVSSLQVYPVKKETCVAEDDLDTPKIFQKDRDILKNEIKLEGKILIKIHRN